MKAIMIMFDSLNRDYLECYGAALAKTPNFCRLARRSVVFENCYAGSLPCMPARRELHTGRTNFLHRSWGPMEPFDLSMPEILKEHGIHSHLASDHTHYWEDGGSTYHTRYSTWEGFRGQEGDPWKGIAGEFPDRDPNLIQHQGYRGKLYCQDNINRTYLEDERCHPQVRTFDAGLEFLEANRDRDNWFLQIETFDPHEPFFSYERFRKLYPHAYHGKRFDWPDYAPVQQSEEEIQEARYAYAALLSMCDEQLGKVLDRMDEYGLWKDTLLIVNTDHGYLLGEHGYWAKNYMPLYEEIVHTPLFIYDPKCGKQGERRTALVQTVDLPVTILNFFGIQVPKRMTGQDLEDTVREDKKIRDGALFGIHGAHVCVTDGRYVYMRAPARKENQPLYEYTWMPSRMVGFFSRQELMQAELKEGGRFTGELPVPRIPAQCGIPAFAYGNLLFDLTQDPGQEHPLEDPETEARMCRLLTGLMKQEDAPAEQYERLGLLEYL